MYSYLKSVVKLFVFFSKVYFNQNTLFSTKSGVKKLCLYLSNLGIIGIKMGQYLNTHVGILNPEYKELITPFLSQNFNLFNHSSEFSRSILNKYDFFRNFQIIRCIGSGSIANTYLVNDGNSDYVIKVLHPNTEELKIDVCILKFCLNWFPYFEWNLFLNNLLEQLDLSKEAQNAIIFGNIYMKPSYCIKIPKIIFFAQDCICMEYCDQTKYIQLNELDQHSPEYFKAYNLLLVSTLHTIFVHNICHGDIHMGNVLVERSGESIFLIDFGICCFIDDPLYRDIFTIYQHVIRNPTFENTKSLLLCIAKEYSDEEYNKFTHICLDTLIKYTYYDRVTNILKIFEDFIYSSKIVMNGNRFLFLIQSFNLHVLSPGHITRDLKINNIVEATTFMLNDEFMSKECETLCLKIENLKELHELTVTDLCKKNE